MADAISLISDGATVAIGGHTLRRHPMAALAEIIRQRKRNLHLVGWNNGIDMDILVGAGAARSVETSYVGISGFGLARNFRRAAEAGEIEIREHSEISALDMFRGGASGIAFTASSVLAGTDVAATNPRIATVTSPFDGRPYTAVQAIRPDVSIIHAHTADALGNVQLDNQHWPDNDADVFVGWAGRTTIVTVEQIVSEDAVRARPEFTILPRDVVTCVVEAPYGAYPCACDARYTYDLEHVADYYAASADATAFARYLERWVMGIADHQGFLEQVGLDRLLAISEQGVL